MARPVKQKADYFPHFVKDSKTKRILQSKWGNDGYAFWFKLLELLCDSECYVLDLSQNDDWEDFLAVMSIPEITANEILKKLSTIGKIDMALWKHKIIWCQSLVNNLEVSLYKRRTVNVPVKPVIDTLNRVIVTETPDSEYNNTQRKEKKREEKKREKKNSSDTPVPPVDKAEDEMPKTPVKTSESLNSFSLFFKTFKKQSNQQEAIEAYELALQKGVSPGDLLMAATKYRKSVEDTQENFTKRADRFIMQKSFVEFLPKHDPSCKKCRGEGWQETPEGMTQCNCHNPYDDIKF